VPQAMQLVQYRTAQVLSIENILAAQTGTRAHQHESATVDGRADCGIGLCTGCDIGTSSQCHSYANAAAADRGALEERFGRARAIERRLRAAQVGARHWSGAGEHVMLETGTVARFAKVGNFSSYCRLRAQRAPQQRQKERRRQCQEWQSLPQLGLCRGGTLRVCATARRRKVFTSAKSVSAMVP